MKKLIDGRKLFGAHLAEVRRTMEAQERTLAQLTTEAPGSYTQEIASEVLKHSHLPREKGDNDGGVDGDSGVDGGDVEMKTKDGSGHGEGSEGERKEREDKQHSHDEGIIDDAEEWEDEKKKKKKKDKKKKKKRESHVLSYSEEVEMELANNFRSHSRPHSRPHSPIHHHSSKKQDRKLDSQMWHIVEELVAERRTLHNSFL